MRAVILALLLAMPAAAQEVPLSPEKLLDRLVGGSAIFTREPDGFPVGVEYFPTRTRSFWKQEGGRCTTGTVSVEDGHLCFEYDDRPGRLHCWAPFKRDGALFYRARESGQVQRIEPVQSLPSDCVDGLMS